MCRYTCMYVMFCFNVRVHYLPLLWPAILIVIIFHQQLYFMVINPTPPQLGERLCVYYQLIHSVYLCSGLVATCTIACMWITIITYIYVTVCQIPLTHPRVNLFCNQILECYFDGLTGKKIIVLHVFNTLNDPHTCFLLLMECVALNRPLII